MTVNLAIARAAQLQPDKVAVRTDDLERNWADTCERISCIAGGLHALGFERGSTLAFLAGNSAGHMELTYAAIWTGIVVVPLNTRLSLDEMAEIVEDSGACALAHDQNFTDHGVKLLERCALDMTINIDDAEYGLERLVQNTPLPILSFRGDEVLGVYYTGGTTGRPKGVELSHNAFQLAALDQATALSLDDKTVYLHAAPYFHLADCSLGNSVTYVCGTHVFTEDLSPPGIVQSLEVHAVNTLSLVPTMYHDLLDYAPGDSLRSVRKAIYGAAPITSALLEKMLVAMPGAKFYQAYGQSEVAGACLILPPDAHQPGGSKLSAAGRATRSVHVRIADESGNEAARGVAGEIQVSGLRIMNGYRGMPEQTAHAFVNGWLKTGDVGVMDDEGYVSVVDRLKDMIVTGGENVFSAEVENVLSSHPGVESVAVVGVPDERWGEAVHAFIVAGSDVEASVLIQYTRDHISGYKCPKGVTFLDELPLSAVGKIRKDVLRSIWLNKSP